MRLWLPEKGCQPSATVNPRTPDPPHSLSPPEPVDSRHSSGNDQHRLNSGEGPLVLLAHCRESRPLGRGKVQHLARICVRPKVKVWSRPLHLVGTRFVTILVNASPEVGEDCHKIGVKRFVLNQRITIKLTFETTLVTLDYD